MNFTRAIRLGFENADIEPVTDLRIIFQVDKAGGEQMNRALITVYNLKPSSRAALLVARPPATTCELSPIKARLFAGYKDSLKEVFAGDLFLASSRRVGEDWITTLELYSGMQSANKARFNTSFDGKTNAKFILDQMLASLKISINYTKEASQILEGKTFFDFSESAMAWKAATVFLRSLNLGFTIEEDEKGLVYVLDKAREEDAQQSGDNTFNQNNGLVGSPVVTRTGVLITSLLRPVIRVQQSIFVESITIAETLQKDELLSNKYYVKSVSHKGDTHSDDWFTSIEATYSDINPEPDACNV